MSPARTPLLLVASAAVLAACAAPASSRRARGAESAPAAVAPSAAAQPPVAAAPRSSAPLPPPAVPAALAVPRAIEAVLPSGLRLVVVEQHRRPLLDVVLVLPTGSLADPLGASGSTNLALQLLSDYRERSPTGEELVDEKSFRRQAAELGGAVQFAIDPDASVIAFSGYPRDAAAYLKLLADAVARPRHGALSFAARRDGLLDALDDLETSDPETLRRVLREAAFGPGQPYARSEVGTRSDLTRLGLEEVEAQQERLLVPRGATLLVVGDVAADRILAEARGAFRRWVSDGTPPLVPQPPGALLRGGVGFLRRQPASTLLVCAARPLGDVRASDAELEVLAAVLGKGIRSRLMGSLRTGPGLAYEAWAELVRHRRGRAFLACAPVDGDHADEGARLFRRTLEELRAAAPEEGEVARARALVLAEREELAEDAAGISHAWIEALVLGQEGPRLGSERAALARVGPADVHRAAKEAFFPDRLQWILSGDGAAASAAAAAGLGPLHPLRPGR